MFILLEKAASCRNRGSTFCRVIRDPCHYNIFMILHFLRSHLLYLLNISKCVLISFLSTNYSIACFLPLVNYFTLFVFSFSSEIAFCSLLNAILYQKYPISFAIAKLSRIGQISRVQLSPFFIKTLHRSTKTRLKLDTNSKFIAID